MKIQDIIESEKIKALFKGITKSGKTIAACSFPDPLLLTFEQRYRVLKSFYPNKNFDVELFREWPEFERRIEQLKTNCPFGTVIWDSFTTGLDALVRNLLRMKGGDSSKGLKKGGYLVPSFDEWAGEDMGAKRALDILLNLPCHFILIAHVTDVIFYDPTGTQMRTIRTLVTGAKKLAAKVPVWFDEMYHFEPEVDMNGQIRYIFKTRAVGVDQAGTAFMQLPDKIDFTGKSAYEELMKYIPKSEKVAEQPQTITTQPLITI